MGLSTSAQVEVVSVKLSQAVTAVKTARLGETYPS